MKQNMKSLFKSHVSQRVHEAVIDMQELASDYNSHQKLHLVTCLVLPDSHSWLIKTFCTEWVVLRCFVSLSLLWYGHSCSLCLFPCTLSRFLEFLFCFVIY